MGRNALDGYSALRGKCAYWRERLNEDDRWDPLVKREDKRVECTCFVEGYVWWMTLTTLPDDCPQRRHCRYYVKTG